MVKQLVQVYRLKNNMLPQHKHMVKQLVQVYRLKNNMLPQHKHTMDQTYISNIRKFNVQFL